MSCPGDNYVVPGANPCNQVDGVQSISAGTNITITGTPTVPIISVTQSALPYTLTGTTAGATITNRAIGSGNPLFQNTFNLISQITFKIPADWTATDSVYYDGWNLSDFAANFNSYWGVSYFTNTFATPTDILGSTTNVNNALNYSNIQQIYLPNNLIIPPTHLTVGGTITLRIYCNPTSINHYLAIPVINQARIGLVKN
jgi:hypothetical protein